LDEGADAIERARRVVALDQDAVRRNAEFVALRPRRTDGRQTEGEGYVFTGRGAAGGDLPIHPGGEGALETAGGKE
jgi:hypothetical protein